MGEHDWSLFIGTYCLGLIFWYVLFSCVGWAWRKLFRRHDTTPHDFWL